MKRNALAVLLMGLFVAGPVAARRKKGEKHELCAIHSVYVNGNSESATAARRQIEKRTWMKLSSTKGKADAILDVAEARSTASTIAGLAERTQVTFNLTKAD